MGVITIALIDGDILRCVVTRLKGGIRRAGAVTMVSHQTFHAVKQKRSTSDTGSRGGR